MSKVATDIHQWKGVFYNGKQKISAEEVHYEIGVVSYPGQGIIGWWPAKQGWWPVIGLKNDINTATKTKILLVCWYQLLSDDQVACWWIST